ncbi:hypothetical protein KC906_00360, partial [Candidatus Kaiserbacteria bacterium]|nr:hypothetical protein [Candidatus Kaiserbacteria bacterium]
RDAAAIANTVRGLEVLTTEGTNRAGENTAISGTGHTFGVRGVTTGEAADIYAPAGGYFETQGTDTGNAIRGYSDTITTANLLSLFQGASDFTGTGLSMNFGTAGGSFTGTSSKYLDFQNDGVSVFTVSAFGTTTIGDGTTNHFAGLQIGFGGLCVANDGSCVASTTGRISAVDYQVSRAGLSETYVSDTELEAGEVVMLSAGLTIDRATRATTTTVLGVVATNPGITLGTAATGYPVALAGRVPVQLSTENGPISKGDQLMLSSLPGVAMKATGTGAVIGIALEDFNDTRYYSDGYLTEFGNDIVEPVYEPIFTEYDPRLNDNCYYSGGAAHGDEPCVPLMATTTEAQLDEANELVQAESEEEALEALREIDSETIELENGEGVQVGQIVMFVQRSERWIDESMLSAIVGLMDSDVSELQDRLELTAEEEGTPLGVMATVIMSISELWNRVTGIEERLDRLEAENAALKHRVSEIEGQAGVEYEAPVDTQPAVEPDPTPTDETVDTATSTENATTTTMSTQEAEDDTASSTPAAEEMVAEEPTDMVETDVTEEASEVEVEEETPAEPEPETAPGSQSTEVTE